MPRFCYCSKILPGKSDEVREHWKTKKKSTIEEKDFWNHLKMTGFDSFLQETSQGDYLIHWDTLTDSVVALLANMRLHSVEFAINDKNEYILHNELPKSITFVSPEGFVNQADKRETAKALLIEVCDYFNC